jgi:hypothetical protein
MLPVVGSITAFLASRKCAISSSAVPGLSFRDPTANRCARLASQASICRWPIRSAYDASMPYAVSAEMWQVVGVAIAAIAALASWFSAIVATRAARDAREAERDASRPRLLLAPAFATSGPLAPTMTLAVHNGGSGIAQNVGVMLVTNESFAYHGLGFVQPGETVYFGSDMPASADFRAVAYGRSAAGEGFAWNALSERRPLSSAPAALPSYADMFAAFYPGEDCEEGRTLFQLLRGSDTLY